MNFLRSSSETDASPPIRSAFVAVEPSPAPPSHHVNHHQQQPSLYPSRPRSDAAPAMDASNSTQSSLAGTKQWLDDVLEASLDANHRDEDDATRTAALDDVRFVCSQTSPRMRPTNGGLGGRRQPTASLQRTTLTRASGMEDFGVAVDDTCSTSGSSSSSTSSSTSSTSTAETDDGEAESVRFSSQDGEEDHHQRHWETRQQRQSYPFQQRDSSSPARAPATLDRLRLPRGAPPSPPQVTFPVSSPQPYHHKHHHHHRNSHHRRQHASLSTQDLLSLYRILDMDNDGVVSTVDLYAFLALHPQSLDLTVETHFYSKSERISRRHHDASDSAAPPIPVVTPCAELSLLSSTSILSATDELRRVSYKRSALPRAKDVEGALWWVHQRYQDDERGRKFVSFLFSAAVSFSVASQNARHQPPQQPRDDDRCGQQHGSAPGTTTTARPTAFSSRYLSFYSFQLIYHETARMLGSMRQSFALVMLDVPMLKRCMWFFDYVRMFSQASGRTWHVRLDALPLESEDATTTDASRRLNFDAALLRSHTLDSHHDSHGNLALPEALSARCWSLFRAALCDERGPQPPLLSTCLPGVYWTFAAWEAQRGIFDVSLLQRVGEWYLKRKASRHTRRMLQFLRHLLVARSMLASAHPGGGAAATGPRAFRLRNGGKDGARAMPHIATDGARRHASSFLSSTDSSLSRKAPSSAAEGLALIKLSSRFLTFHGFNNDSVADSLDDDDGGGGFDEQSSNCETVSTRRSSSSGRLWRNEQHVSRRTSSAAASTNGGAPTNAAHRRKSLAEHVAEEGVGALWDVQSSASTQASPKAPVRRSTWRAVGPLSRNNNNTSSSSHGAQGDSRPGHRRGGTLGADASEQATTVAASAVDAEEPLFENVVRQSLLEQDHTLHSILKPDPLSLIPSLNAGDRAWMHEASWWCAFRAALYALISGALLGAADVAAQMIFLGTSSSSFAQFNVFSFQSLGSLFQPPTTSTTTGDSSSTASSPLYDSNSSALLLLNESSSSSSQLSTGLFSSNSNVAGFIKYQVCVLVLSLLISVAEIIFLYLDNLQVCLGIARNGGIPLDNNNTSASSRKNGDGSGSSSFAATPWDHAQRWLAESSFGGGGGGGGGGAGGGGGGGDQLGLESNHELRSIRASLAKKRVSFLVAAISRCALQLNFESTTVFALDVKDRNITRLRVGISAGLERLRRVAPALFLRVIASRLLSRFLVPFLATPIMMFWNCVLTRRCLEDASNVVLGAINVERLVNELLSKHFTSPIRVLEQNRRMVQQQSDVLLAASFQHPPSRQQGGVDAKKWLGSHLAPGSHVYLTRPLFSVPFHVLREMLMLVLFHAHVVEDHVVPPVLHCLLVQLLTSCEFPDVCLWMCPKEEEAQQQGGEAGDRTLGNSSLSREPRKDAAVSGVGAGLKKYSSRFTDISLQSGNGPPGSQVQSGGGSHAANGLRRSGAAAPLLAGVPASRFVDAVLLDVAGNRRCALGSWLRAFLRELNVLRRETQPWSATAEWVRWHVHRCPWTADAEQRSAVCSCVLKFLRLGDIEHEQFLFLVESVFPGWASARHAGPRHQTSAAATCDPVSTSRDVRGARRSCSANTASEESSTTVPPTTRTGSVPVSEVNSDADGENRLLEPFETAHVRLLLTLSILLCVLPARRSTDLWENKKRRALILHVHRVYCLRVTHPQKHHRLDDVFFTERGNFLLQQVQDLLRLYAAGTAMLSVATVERMIEASSQVS